MHVHLYFDPVLITIKTLAVVRRLLPPLLKVLELHPEKWLLEAMFNASGWLLSFLPSPPASGRPPVDVSHVCFTLIWEEDLWVPLSSHQAGQSTSKLHPGSSLTGNRLKNPNPSSTIWPIFVTMLWQRPPGEHAEVCVCGGGSFQKLIVNSTVTT